MDARIQEAVDLFTEVLVYGTERVLKSIDDPLWKEYSPEQIQMLKLISKEQRITSGRLAILQAVHKSAISSRIKKMLDKGLVQIVETPNRREKVFELTVKGEEVLVASDAVLTDYVGKLFGQHISDEEIDQFLVTFRKLKDIIKTDGV